MKESFEKLGDRHFSLIAWIVGTVIASTGVAVTALKFFAAA
jgi:hypothetical protein